jgi:hypothetical protein
VGRVVATYLNASQFRGLRWKMNVVKDNYLCLIIMLRCGVSLSPVKSRTMYEDEGAMVSSYFSFTVRSKVSIPCFPQSSSKALGQ